MIGENRPNIVIPTCRSPDFFGEFLESWKDEFKGCHLIVLEDKPQITRGLYDVIEKYGKASGFTCDLYSWNEIDTQLKDKSWIITRRTDCVRSFGFFRAWVNRALFILTLDDDTKPLESGFVQKHYQQLMTTAKVADNYYSTLKNVLPRGALKDVKAVGINHGGWVEVPDLDAKTQIEHLSQKLVSESDFNEGIIPKGCLFSMCGMNLSFRTELAPLMYFGLQGQIKGPYGQMTPLPIDRCGDIWCGYYAKTKLDEEGRFAVRTGEPYVIHQRASNAWTNLIKEQEAERMGQQFLKFINTQSEEPYWKTLDTAYKVWESLFEELIPEEKAPELPPDLFIPEAEVIADE